MEPLLCNNTPPALRARILVEALPYIRNFKGRRIVIKYGGSAMTEAALKNDFAQDVALLSFVGMKPVIVHGGGPQIGELLKKIGKETRFVKGLRVTDEETMDVVEMVLVAKVNKDVVSMINYHGGRAVGLSGRDGGLIRAKKARPARLADTDEDLGLVGEVDKINPELISSLEERGFIPVIAPVGAGPDEKPYNINADTAAGALSAALKAEKFILLTDVPGVMDKDNQLISSLSEDQAADLIRTGAASGGMIPKIRCCLSALHGGVPKAHVIDGRVPHALLLELLTEKGIGTEIVRERAPGF
ncbi:MAG: acetylglutamate kinase [Deltaproteobacteria bacterium]|nr:acetylglutamate kinase [Deltaproteobacteria bacterium]